MVTAQASAPERWEQKDDIAEREPQWFRLRSVDWETYRTIADALTGRHVRLTYDRGTLEFMTISSLHGTVSRLLLLFVSVLAEELNMTMQACGDMTLNRQDLQRGIEADETFYLANAPLVRHKSEIDLTTDPPPDLAVEVDITHSSRRRMPVYQAIAVPEIWCSNGETVVIHVRDADGQYAVTERSRAFPFLSGAQLARFLQQRTQTDEIALVRLFRTWVREQIAKKSPT